MRVWHGTLDNIGVVILGGVCSVVYLAVQRFTPGFRLWLRSIAPEWLATPLVLLLVGIAVISTIAVRQRKQLRALANPTPSDDQRSRLVTHFGVWWKLFEGSDFIEDMPYCPCCNPNRKLVQREWYPDEVFVCPNSKTAIRLFDKVPIKKERALQVLYNTYVRRRGEPLVRHLRGEIDRQKQLRPEMSDQEQVEWLFSNAPLNRIPQDQVEDLRTRLTTVPQLLFYFGENIRPYERYLRKKHRE